MSGDEQKRFCSKCTKHVHNLSEMTADEAEATLAVADGKLCVRFQRDAVGRVRTRSGWIAGLAAAGAMVALPMAGCASDGAVPGHGESKPTKIHQLQGTPPVPSQTLTGEVAVQPEPAKTVMGDIAVPPKDSAAGQTMGNVVTKVPVQPQETMGKVVVEKASNGK